MCPLPPMIEVGLNGLLKSGWGRFPSLPTWFRRFCVLAEWSVLLVEKEPLLILKYMQYSNARIRIWKCREKRSWAGALRHISNINMAFVVFTYFVWGCFKTKYFLFFTNQAAGWLAGSRYFSMFFMAQLCTRLNEIVLWDRKKWKCLFCTFGPK